jgi:hypothetical protein
MSVDRPPAIADAAADAAGAGPQRSEPRALLGGAAVVIWNDIKPEGRDAFYAWHDREHMPERLALPGFLRGRRLRKPGHSPEWLTLYEAASLDALVSPEYLARLNAPTPQTTATLRYFERTSRAVCRVAHSSGGSTGGFILALRVDAPAERVAAIAECVTTTLFPRAMSENGVVACHLCIADEGASFVRTAESRTRAFDVPAVVLLVEATREDAAARARALLDGEALRAAGGQVRPDGATYALEICRLGALDAIAREQ